MTQATFSRNGKPSSRIAPAAPRAVSQAASRKPKPASTISSGMRCHMILPCYFVGLGTTGSATVQRVIDRVIRALGRLPGCLNYLLVDAANDFHAAHRAHAVSIGTDGAGTNPHHGRRRWRSHQTQLRHVVIQHADDLFCGSDPLLAPAKTAREAVDVFVIAGCGGTSGGCLDPAIDLVHDVFHRRGAQEVRLHVVLIGPGMILHDSSKQVLPEQREMMKFTYAENLCRIYQSMASSGHYVGRRGDGSEFSVPRSRRVWSLRKLNHTNGLTEFATTEALNAMLGRALFLHVLTAAGNHVDQRTCDHRGLRITGQPGL